uniref:TIGR02611 family protein n=1 Tax=Micromonospora craniellae TaxID=2294034 RepID=UPI0037C90955
MDQLARRGPSNGAARRAEQRGCGVPKEQRDRHGRSVVDHEPADNRRTGRNERGFSDGNSPAGRGNPHRMCNERTETDRASDGPGAAAVPGRPRWRQRLSTTLALVRANPTGRLALRVVIGVLGALVVTIGIVLIPLPGPGWLLVIFGLGIWAVEFHWAKRLLAFTRRHVYGWTAWVKRQSLALRLVIGSVGLVFVGAIALISIKYSLGIDVIAQVLRYLATN